MQSLPTGIDALEVVFQKQQERFHTVRIIPVILSGGGGTRLWPMSRPESPKQFLALTSDQTMFQMTLERTRDPAIYDPPIVVAGISHAEIVMQQIAEIGISGASIILEPSARNTAPAIALAALAASDPAAALLVMPSDHVITRIDAFHTAIAAALPMVEDGWLVTFGIDPTGPETGYGYIQMSEQIAPGVKRAASFIEKPDAAHAKGMLQAGNHVWNGGIFLFRADHYLNALAAFAPEMLASAEQAMAAAKRDGAAIHPDPAAFATSPSDSIDYAVMEKAERVAVVPVNMGWSDVGSWDALYDLGAQSTPGDCVEVECNGNLIRSDGIRIHVAGVENMIIVANGNDVLIVPRGKSQDVKKIVEALMAKQI
jgi:mannose-1-phosphate guanylyltransferase